MPTTDDLGIYYYFNLTSYTVPYSHSLMSKSADSLSPKIWTRLEDEDGVRGGNEQWRGRSERLHKLHCGTHNNGFLVFSELLWE